MRHASIKMFCALAVAGLGAAVVAGCGNDVPPNAVATVGDSVITQDEFNKWLKTASAGQAQGGDAPAAPDPPDFKKCVAAKQKQPVPKGQDKPSDAQLKKQCEQQFDQLKTEVMQFLIQAEWVQQEAEAQGVKVTEKEIKRSFEDQKKQAFPNDKAYEQFLKSSGMTEADILFRVRLDQLQQKLTQKVTEDAKKVSDQDVSEYYDKNKKRFAQPERRDLLVVLTKTKAKADQAKKALEDGQSWKQVVKRYSIDEASKAQGGKLPAVSKGQNEKALDEAIFGARKGEIEGPVKTQFGWYVFEVRKVTPASQQSLEESKETIRNLLRSQGQQKALDSFIKDFRENYKDDTECADDYRVAECKNAPKESTETGPASGNAPGGQSQPQQPQQPAQPQPETPSQQNPQQP
ncbi:MAG TPA: peptidyl-prolyl cis-trans isomerase [Thermoleophilaceae bacterium]